MDRRVIITAITVFAASFSASSMQAQEVGQDDVLEFMRFIEGTWINTDITLRPGDTPQIRRHFERMVVRDDTTLNITAYDLGPGGQDINRDITFVARGDSIVMGQRGFEARGVREANRLTLQGEMDGHTYVFRLYMLDNHYVYQMDVWFEERIVQSQMSYLTRAPSP
jgi:hypothetical protein